VYERKDGEKDDRRKRDIRGSVTREALRHEKMAAFNAVFGVVPHTPFRASLLSYFGSFQDPI
jgi:hypothetical protein